MFVSSSYFRPKDLSTLRRARSNLVIGQRKLITAHRYALIWEVSPTDQKIWLYFVRISGGHLWLIYSWSCYMMVLQVLRSLHGWQFPIVCLENLNSATFYVFLHIWIWTMMMMKQQCTLSGSVGRSGHSLPIVSTSLMSFLFFHRHYHHYCRDRHYHYQHGWHCLILTLSFLFFHRHYHSHRDRHYHQCYVCHNHCQLNFPSHNHYHIDCQYNRYLLQ